MTKSNVYLKTLSKILKDENPVAPTGRSRADIEKEITGISEKLMGPLSNFERLCLVEDRMFLRKQLATIPALPD